VGWLQFVVANSGGVIEPRLDSELASPWCNGQDASSYSPSKSERSSFGEPGGLDSETGGERSVFTSSQESSSIFEGASGSGYSYFAVFIAIVDDVIEPFRDIGMVEVGDGSEAIIS